MVLVSLCSSFQSVGECCPPNRNRCSDTNAQNAPQQEAEQHQIRARVPTKSPPVHGGDPCNHGSHHCTCNPGTRKNPNKLCDGHMLWLRVLRAERYAESVVYR